MGLCGMNFSISTADCFVSHVYMTVYDLEMKLA